MNVTTISKVRREPVAQARGPLVSQGLALATILFSYDDLK
jgi:hypothetical protein